MQLLDHQTLYLCVQGVPNHLKPASVALKYVSIETLLNPLPPNQQITASHTSVNP